MPKILTWSEETTLDHTVGQDVDLAALHAAVSRWSLQQTPPFVTAALNPSWVKYKNGFMEVTTFCICCTPKCSLRVRLRGMAEQHVEVALSGGHAGKNPCSKRVRGYTATEKKVVDPLVNPSSGDIHDAVEAADGGRKLLQRVQRRFAEKRLKAAKNERLECAGQLRAWAADHPYQRANLQRHDVFVLGCSIQNANDEEGKFRLAFACRGHQEVLEKLECDESIALAMDGTFRITWSNYVLMICGLLHLAQSAGKVRSGKGGRGNVVLPRVSFAPLCFCLLESEKGAGCEDMIRWYMAFLEKELPEAFAKVRKCKIIATDFGEAAPRGLKLLCSEEPVHKECFVHLMRNVLQKTGKNKIQKRANLKKIQDFLHLLREAWSEPV